MLAHGLALAALHGESTPPFIDTLCKSLIARLANTVADDATVQRLRLRALAFALSYSQLNGNLPVRLELDAIAAHCLLLLSERCVEAGRWWTERTLIEIFTFRTERRAEPSIPSLLAHSERA